MGIKSNGDRNDSSVEVEMLGGSRRELQINNQDANQDNQDDDQDTEFRNDEQRDNPKYFAKNRRPKSFADTLWGKLLFWKSRRRDKYYNRRSPSARPSRSGKETERKIKANDRQFNSQFKYANNYIQTSKYSLVTFIPLNLLEQFQRLANFYFLCLMVLQMINVISSLTPITTAVPLIGVLCLTAIKDAYDDAQRHISDSQVNNRKAYAIREGKLVEGKWSQVRVGDIIRMQNDEFVAADVLLLSTSEPSGLCFIETAELDGETNLKSRQCLQETAFLGQDEALLGSFDGEILCEPPNNLLNKFEGTLLWNGNKYSLDNEKVVLRGCILRNTEWCYGVVVFAGKDTKLMQNSGKTKFKRTSIDKLLNFLILGIVFFLISICVFCMVACWIWETLTGVYFQVYLPWDALVPSKPVPGATVIALLVFFSYAIVLNTVVPISLYVSVECIRLMQSFLINWDEQMFCEKNQLYAKARTTTLNEELGQIQYIFSDKTGTLTQNIMTFHKCSIGGSCYGEIIDKRTGEILEPNEFSSRVDFSFNPDYETNFQFYDQGLVDLVRTRKNPDIDMFFKVLALCHTVMPAEREGKVVYQAQSPDEAALVSAARNFGYVFRERTPYSITIDILGERQVYELLCILDFNNVRKRMSVILKHNGEIRLYCKGADNVVYDRLRKGDNEMKRLTQDHLNRFAGDGLRTLCLAVRDLDEDYFNGWKARHHEAALSMENRDDKLDAIYEEIEHDLRLLGATAIEDKLQDGVPETIAKLGAAGIKTWVLTGDKQETAINIGYSCNLLSDEMEVMIVDGHTVDEVNKQLQKCRDTLMLGGHPMAQNQHNNNGHPPTISIITFSETDYKRPDTEEDTSQLFALVINGHSLVHVFHPQVEKLFLEVAIMCKSVICCRVTPLQKALVVELIKKNKKAVTLAIGDGANDVSMIKAAHIGIGISGEEGNQAMLASDYSIGQFRFLQRLLLVHGRWSYYRMCKFLRYFFYKNFAFTICHFWYAFFCGFSAQTVFDPMFIAVYNLFYTSMPVLAIGVFDQDVSDKNSLMYPQLYTPGHHNLLFNKHEFLKSALYGCYTSCIIFLIPYGTFHDELTSEGHVLSDHLLLGSVVATILVIVVTAQVCLDTSYWTYFNWITIIGSLTSYFVLDLCYNYITGGSYVGPLTMALSQWSFWFTTALTLAILLVPVLAYRFFFIDVFPTLSDRIRLKQRMTHIRSRHSADMLRTPSARKARRSIRSGYAFSHQEGFGRLITSGKIMRKLPSGRDFLNHLSANNHHSPVRPQTDGDERERSLPPVIPMYLP
ncbi:E1-E2 ATPase [Nesidiocoris tenuis]|uniref:Phospholipid-transporting ATPase n=1 Tax=Nesidiocoris tenuis TaxID=355587 RepID=A0ABN7A9V0_9HEMI|nr:E1-E2 ATPase [Nesidiocoris tenuis]